jgi:hypothetical protein
METRTDYFKVYYDKHKNVLNERRLFDYYTKKFGKDFVEKIKKEHDEPIEVLKKHSKLTIKLNKVQKRKDDLQNELNNLESMKSKL